MLTRLLAVFCTLWGGLFGYFVPQEATAQGFPSEYVQWEPSLSADEVGHGHVLSLQLHATIADDWKMYALDSPPMSWHARVEFDALPQGVTLNGDVTQVEPRSAYDKNFKVDVTYFVKETTFMAQFGIQEDAAMGLQVISGKVGYQICNDDLGICLTPYWEPFTASFDIVADATPGGAASEQTQHLAEEVLSFTTPDVNTETNAAPESAPVEVGAIESMLEDVQAKAGSVEETTGAIRSGNPLSQRAGGIWGFMMLAIGAGLGALLMPCVFPMIPLTVSYFTKHAHNRSEAVRMATVYGLSIILIFTGLGVLMALLIGASGAQMIAANPWINLGIGLVFIVFALSLLGLFELSLPSSFVNYFNRQSNERQGYAGVLFMGTTLTLVSFSCTAPFVGTLLAATAGGEWIYPIIGMLIFSTTFAFPFVLFALFPNGLSRLPASGSWMNTLKVVFGFIELVAAIKFLSNADLVWGWNVISRPMAISASVVIFFLTGTYLIGKLRLKHEEPLEQIGTGRLIASIGFFALALYMLPGLFGAPLNNLDAYLPPRQGTDMSLVASVSAIGINDIMADERWFEDIDSAYAEAEALGKPVFIDFTGYTCTNCRQMESTVFPQAAVADRLDRNYVLLRLYTDDLDEGPTLQKFQLELTGTVALPTYAIVDPATGSLIGQRSGIQSVDKFADFLDVGTDVYHELYLASSK